MLKLNRAPHSALVGGYDLLGEAESQEDLFDEGAGDFDGAQGTDSWTVYGTNTIAPSTDIAYNGTKSAKITYVDESRGANLLLQDAKDLKSALTIGAKYRAKMRSAVSSGASVNVQVYNGSTIFTMAIVTSETMVPIQYDFIALSANNCDFRMAGMAAGEIIYLDAISLQELYTPDYSGRANHGTVNGATATPWGYSFDGVDDFISMGDVLDMGISDFTILTKIKTTQSSVQIGLITKGGWGGNGFRFDNNSSRLRGRLDGVVGSIEADLDTTINISDGIEHDLAIVWDRSANMTGYIDGKVGNNPQDISGITGSIDNSDNLYFGRNNGAVATYGLNGDMRFAMIYNRVLTQREILEEMRRLSHPSSLSLVA